MGCLSFDTQSQRDGGKSICRWWRQNCRQSSPNRRLGVELFHHQVLSTADNKKDRESSASEQVPLPAKQRYSITWKEDAVGN
jgi:hypothetical protein